MGKQAKFGVLGEIRVCAGGHEVDLGHAKQRCVLAALLTSANRAVSLDQLVERIWGNDPPHKVAGTVRSYMSRLRTALADVEDCYIERRSAGYAIHVPEIAVDMHQFRRYVAQVSACDDDDRAAELFSRALALWRGEPFGDMDTPWLASVRHALRAERIAAQLNYHDVQFRRGQHASVLPQLSTLAEAHPLDERLAGQYMFALYRSGRAAEALQHYRNVRTRLTDEVGSDPGPALQRLHQQILTVDRVLAAPTAPAQGFRYRRAWTPRWGCTAVSRQANGY